MTEFIEFDDLGTVEVEGTINPKMSNEEILERLLGAESVSEKVVPIPRLKVPFTLKGITQKEIQAIRKECSKKKIKNGVQIDEFNNDLFYAKVLQKGLVKPVITQEILEQAKSSSALNFLTKTLTPGEYEMLIATILELSGYQEDFDVDMLRD